MHPPLHHQRLQTCRSSRCAFCRVDCLCTLCSGLRRKALQAVGDGPSGSGADAGLGIAMAGPACAAPAHHWPRRFPHPRKLQATDGPNARAPAHARRPFAWVGPPTSPRPHWASLSPQSPVGRQNTLRHAEASAVLTVLYFHSKNTAHLLSRVGSLAWYLVVSHIHFLTPLPRNQLWTLPSATTEYPPSAVF